MKLLARSQLRPGNVVLTITGTYGIAGVVPPGFGEANINQHSVKIVCGPAIDPNYLSVFLNSTLCRPQLDRAVTGSTRPALDYTAIKNLRILFPKDLREQRSLADATLIKRDRAVSLKDEAEKLSDALPGILGSGEE